MTVTSVVRSASVYDVYRLPQRSPLNSDYVTSNYISPYVRAARNVVDEFSRARVERRIIGGCGNLPRSKDFLASISPIFPRRTFTRLSTTLYKNLKSINLYSKKNFDIFFLGTVDLTIDSLRSLFRGYNRRRADNANSRFLVSIAIYICEKKGDNYISIIF